MSTRDCSEANNNIEEMPDFLSPEQHQLLSERPNIRGIMDKMVLMQQKAMLEVLAGWIADKCLFRFLSRLQVRKVNPV